MNNVLAKMFNQFQSEKLRFDAEDVTYKFDSLVKQFANDSMLRLDAGESAVLARQLLVVQTREVNQLYYGLFAPQFIPVDTSISNAATSYSTKIWQHAGTAKMVTDYATDFPAVDVTLGEAIFPIRSIGASYGYSVQELRASALVGGTPIDQRRASVARMVHDQFIDQLACYGDTVSGIPGFAKNTQVSVATAGGAVTGAWTMATSADVIFNDLNIIAQIPNNVSKGVWQADTIVLPTLAFSLIAAKPATAFDRKPILAQFLDNNPFIKNIAQWPLLDTAGAAGVTRAVCYKRHIDVLDQKVPQMFEQFAPQLQNLKYTIACHSRHGGCPIYFPQAMVYVDGLV